MKRLLALFAVALLACQRREAETNFAGGDPNRGRLLMARDGCAACHELPGPGVRGLVGPSLEAMGRRAYIAGKLPNVPQNMILWIRFPQAVDPGNAMPNLGINERDARDMTAYLEALR